MQRATLPRLTDRLPLGESGLRVSPGCLGNVRDPKIVLAALEAGINFFFVSGDLHWPIYEEHLMLDLGRRIGAAVRSH